MNRTVPVAVIALCILALSLTSAGTAVITLIIDIIDLNSLAASSNCEDFGDCQADANAACTDGPGASERTCSCDSGFSGSAILTNAETFSGCSPCTPSLDFSISNLVWSRQF